MRGVARGGKGLWFKQVLQSGLEGRLVALDRQEKIAPLFKEDLLSGIHLGMQRVGQLVAREVAELGHVARGHGQ